MAKRIRNERYKIDYSRVFFAGYHYSNLKRLAVRWNCSELQAARQAVKILADSQL